MDSARNFRPDHRQELAHPAVEHHAAHVIDAVSALCKGDFEQPTSSLIMLHSTRRKRKMKSWYEKRKFNKPYHHQVWEEHHSQGMNLEEATAKDRNAQIGGHKARANTRHHNLPHRVSSKTAMSIWTGLRVLSFGAPTGYDDNHETARLTNES